MRVAIIGTSGRNTDAPKMTMELFEAMVERTLSWLEKLLAAKGEITLISGGGAWSDHVAVLCHMRMAGKVRLELHLPAAIGERGFCSHQFKDAGSVSNYYHKLFSQKVFGSGEESVKQIYYASKEPHVHIEVHKDFRSASSGIEDSDILLCFGWAEGNEPQSSGARRMSESGFKYPVQTLCYTRQRSSRRE